VALLHAALPPPARPPATAAASPVDLLGLSPAETTALLATLAADGRAAIIGTMETLRWRVEVGQLSFPCAARCVSSRVMFTNSPCEEPCLANDGYRACSLVFAVCART